MISGFSRVFADAVGSRNASQCFTAEGAWNILLI